MGVSAIPSESRAVNNPERCQCVDDILAPIRSKMKVLKKIKKRIGLSPRTCNGTVNNLPPILFHQVHGDNVRLSQGGTVARRVESFCRGVAFTSRPIKVQERVCVKFLEVSNNWSGVLRFGFTSTDPNNIRYVLPKYVCPDLTNKPGYWAKALAERFSERGTILFFYVTQAGDVHFGINGEEKGIFFSGVDTRGPLWGIFDIYGNSTGIEFLSPRTHLNNFRSPSVESIISPLQSMRLSPQSSESSGDSRHYYAGHIAPLSFHKTRGHNIRLSNDKCVASRSDTEFCHGYVFTARPIHLEEKIVIQVLATESMYVGALAFGLTSCDPATLSASELPEDADALLDRREYWVVNKDVASIPQRGDELTFSVSAVGEVTLAKNGGPPIVFMHVDHTLKLWAFFDVYGSTQKIRLADAVQIPARQEPVRRSTMSVQSPTHHHSSSPSPVPVNGVRQCCQPASSGTTSSIPAPSAELLQLQPTMGGGTVLVVNLPPAQSNFINQQSSQQSHHSHSSQHSSHSPAVSVSQQSAHNTNIPVAVSQHSAHSANISGAQHSQHLASVADRSSTLVSNYSSTYIEPVSSGSYSTVDSMGPWVESAMNSGAAGSECSVCYERAIDSVLYMCGHMCMCYECAVQQWRGKGGGHCPLCRAVIRDVIRTYKS